MTQTIQIGQINTLLIDRITRLRGFFRDLDGKDVFVYTDSEDRIVATTETPKAYADEFGVFEALR